MVNNKTSNVNSNYNKFKVEVQYVPFLQIIYSYPSSGSRINLWSQINLAKI